MPRRTSAVREPFFLCTPSSSDNSPREAKSGIVHKHLMPDKASRIKLAKMEITINLGL